ncbi:MAG: pyridoxal-phosphate dependent enzyme [Oscillospiraceae bacterium]|nr:pyridoxal-phosphate dependent enzyme [Oscillospiraceae bacterium]
MRQIEILQHSPTGGSFSPIFCGKTFAEVLAFHRSLPGYFPTPLISLPALAQRLGVGGIYLKDESQRFGLGAFKALGASYALHRALVNNPGTDEIVTATDGNYGRAVAWAAVRAKRRVRVFMPKSSALCRAEATRREGAEVVIIKHGYNDTVRTAAAYAREKGACLLQNTGFE